MTVYNMLNLRRLTVFMISLQDLIPNLILFVAVYLDKDLFFYNGSVF